MCECKRYQNRYDIAIYGNCTMCGKYLAVKFVLFESTFLLNISNVESSQNTGGFFFLLNLEHLSRLLSITTIDRKFGQVFVIN